MHILTKIYLWTNELYYRAGSSFSVERKDDKLDENTETNCVTGFAPRIRVAQPPPMLVQNEGGAA